MFKFEVEFDGVLGRCVIDIAWKLFGNDFVRSLLDRDVVLTLLRINLS